MAKKEIKDFYSKMSADYDEVVVKTSYKHQLSLVEWVIKELGNKKARVLDLGCGTGLSSVRLKAAGYELTGVEINKDMIKEALKKKIFQQLISQNLEEEIQVKTNHFDVVVLIGVFDFIKNPNEFIKEVFRVLKSKGLFLITVAEVLGNSKSSIKSYSKNDFGAMIKKIGFQVIRYKKLPGYKTKDEVSIYHGFLPQKIL